MGEAVGSVSRLWPIASYSWFNSGGAYYVIVLVWVASAIFFSGLALRTHKDSDGCLLAIANFLLALGGGGMGLLLFAGRFPIFVLTSAGGSIMLPWILTRWFASRTKAGR
jgi:hypothetical protein